MSGFEKPYPPDPITYNHYNILVDALESRFGSGVQDYIQDRKRIINTRGNIWEYSPGNIQQAIQDLYNDQGGAIWLPKGMITETQPWTLDEAYPVHIHGAGMCWHDTPYGTMIKFNLANGVHCIDIGKPDETIHFGGIYDLAILPVAGDRDVIHIDRQSDWHMERVYINQPRRHGLHVESSGDSWNLWIKDCLIENAVGSGIRLDGGVGSGVILKSYFLSNYFYANNIDFEIGALDGVEGKVRFCQFHNNQHFNTVGVGFRMYRQVESVLIMGHIFYKTGGDAIEISDNGEAYKCTRINIGPILIDGQATTPNGVDIQGYTDHLILDNYQIYGVTASAVNQGVNVTNIHKGDGYES